MPGGGKRGRRGGGEEREPAGHLEPERATKTVYVRWVQDDKRNETTRTGDNMQVLLCEVGKPAARPRQRASTAAAGVASPPSIPIRRHVV